MVPRILLPRLCFFRFIREFWRPGIALLFVPFPVLTPIFSKEICCVHGCHGAEATSLGCRALRVWTRSLTDALREEASSTQPTSPRDDVLREERVQSFSFQWASRTGGMALPTTTRWTEWQIFALRNEQRWVRRDDQRGGNDNVVLAMTGVEGKRQSRPGVSLFPSTPVMTGNRPR